MGIDEGNKDAYRAHFTCMLQSLTLTFWFVNVEM